MVDTSPYYTQTYRSSQDGSRVGGLGAWEEAATTLIAYGLLGAPAGVGFNLLTNFESALGLPLDPPGFTAITLTLRHVALLTFSGAATATVGLWLMNSYTPAVWSTSNLPSTTGATLLTTWNVSTTPSTQTYALTSALVRSRTSHPSWRGRLSFVLAGDGDTVTSEFASNEAATVADRPLVTTTEWPFNTGITTPDIRRRGRIRTCPRAGTPHFADEFVQDGYLRGLWVHRDEFDPEDRSDEYIQPASEGKIHDEVP